MVFISHEYVRKHNKTPRNARGEISHRLAISPHKTQIGSWGSERTPAVPGKQVWLVMASAEHWTPNAGGERRGKSASFFPVRSTAWLGGPAWADVLCIALDYPAYIPPVWGLFPHYLSHVAA